MNGARHHFLASASFAKDQHRGIGSRDFSHSGHHLAQSRLGTDDGICQPNVFTAQTLPILDHAFQQASSLRAQALGQSQHEVIQACIAVRHLPCKVFQCLNTFSVL